MKCRKALPKSALPAAVEKFVGTNSDGTNGPLGMDILHAKKKASREADPFFAC
jgi:hypothetical protein